MKADLHNMNGKKAGEIDLPDHIFGVEVNNDLLHQVLRAQMLNRRQGSAHTKDRSEVRGGGKKPWRQKGTGRARHGSRRSPIWIGGGVTFGPRNDRNYKKAINKKARRKALFMAISAKKKGGLIFFVSDLKIKEPKTKTITQFLQNIPCAGNVLIALPEIDKNIILSTRNLHKVDTIQAKDLNLLDVVSYEYLIIPQESVAIIEENFARQSEDEKTEKDATEEKKNKQVKKSTKKPKKVEVSK